MVAGGEVSASERKPPDNRPQVACAPEVREKCPMARILCLVRAASPYKGTHAAAIDGSRQTRL
jgi:hypothetical protein